MKSIIRFYLKNKKICIIGIAALLICFSYIVTYNMPDYLGIEGWYSFANNIAISYLAAVIFYIVQVYIPNEDSQKKSLEILKPKFEKMIEFIEISILVYKKFFELQKQGAKIKWTGSNVIDFKYGIKGNDNKTLKRYTRSELLRLTSTLNTMIDEISNATVFKYCDYDVVKLISEIQKCNVLEQISSTVQFSETVTSLNPIDNQIKEMMEIIENIKKLYGIETEYEIDGNVELRERIILDMLYSDMEKNLRNVDIINKQIFRADLEEWFKEQGIAIKFDEETLDKLYDEAKKNNEDEE